MAVTLQSQIRQLVADWVPIVGLTHWGLSVRFDEKEHMATAAANPEYLQVVIRFNLQRIREEPRTAAWLSELVLHELCHALTWTACRALAADNPTEWVRQVEERVTSEVARAIWRARYRAEAP